MIERIFPAGAPQPRGPYSPAVRVGDFLYISGMPPVNPATRQPAPGGVAAETRQSLNNIKSALEGAGASLEDVVKVNAYLSDAADFAAMNEAYAEFFGNAKPARTTVVVEFALAGICVEFDAVAYHPRQFRQ